MKKNFNKLLVLLDKNHKRNFYIIIFFAIIGSFFEVFSLFAIGPFISLLTNPELIYENGLLGLIYSFLNVDYKVFVVIFGIFLCLLVFISNLLLILMSWKSHKFGQFVGSYFSQILFNKYISQDYLSYKNSNNSIFIKNIIFESRRCSDGVLGPFTTLFSRSVLILSISISLFFINFLATSIFFLFFILSYLTLFNLVKKKLNKINLNLSLHEKNRYKYTDDTFSGIKEIKISLAENIFKKLFAKESDGYAYSQSLAMILAQFPRFIFETLSIFIIVIFSSRFLFLFSKESFTSIIPLISIYAFAGFKILPSLQLIYFSFATIRSNQNSIDIIYDDLASEISSITNNKKYIKDDTFININETIEFKNISFNYPTKKIIKNVSLKLFKGEIIGIYGKSGAGKSTLIDLLMGLIKFEKGEVLIDEVKSKIFENPEWFKNLSYLSQNIFVFDGSLEENIVFYKQSVDKNKENLIKAIKLANLEKIGGKNLDLNQNLGYSANKISGGEKQRVGIARALYRDTKVLIFDEPTSSLDHENERIFRETILNIKKNRFIIIISHNKDTLRVCDKIYQLKDENLILKNDSNF